MDLDDGGGMSEFTKGGFSSLGPEGSPTELIMDAVMELPTDELPTELVLPECPRGVGYNNSSGNAVRRRILGPAPELPIVPFVLPFTLYIRSSVKKHISEQCFRHNVKSQQTKQKTKARGRHIMVYITVDSWLQAGVKVLSAFDNNKRGVYLLVNWR